MSCIWVVIDRKQPDSWIIIIPTSNNCIKNNLYRSFPVEIKSNLSSYEDEVRKGYIGRFWNIILSNDNWVTRRCRGSRLHCDDNDPYSPICGGPAMPRPEQWTYNSSFMSKTGSIEACNVFNPGYHNKAMKQGASFSCEGRHGEGEGQRWGGCSRVQV